MKQVEATHDINDYNCLANTKRIDPQDIILCRTIDVLEDESDLLIGPEIIAK